MKSTIYLLVLALLTVNSFAQELQFLGKFEPGTLIIAKGDPVQSASLNEQKLKVDEDLFCFGFDAAEKGSQILKVKFKEGKVLLKKIHLGQRKFQIERINNMKSDYVSPSDTLQIRIKREREIALKARSPIGKIDTALYRSGFLRPIRGGRISGVFGSQRVLNGVPKNRHNGLDIAVPTGTPVYAMADGIVRLAADDFFYPGNYILLDHGQGLNSQYLHLSKKDVKTGDRVKKGQLIGRVGTTGRSTGPHLHWSVQWYLRRLDPARLLTMGYSE